MALTRSNALALVRRVNGSGGDLMDTALEAAFSEGGLPMAEQPIVPLGERQRHGRWVELLARPSVNGARLSTQAFIGRAMERGVARELDLLVLRTGLAWLNRTPDVSLCSLNVSGESLSQPRFLREVMRLLEDSRVEPSRVCIEVTESVPIREFPAARDFARELRAAGARMALDDFGGGSSNMLMLVPLEMDYIKIDGRFVQPMPDREDCRRVVRGVIAFARELGLATVAESVESPEHFDLAERMKVDYAQGYHNQGAPRMVAPEPAQIRGRGRPEPDSLAPGRAG